MSLTNKSRAELQRLMRNNNNDEFNTRLISVLASTYHRYTQEQVKEILEEVLRGYGKAAIHFAMQHPYLLTGSALAAVAIIAVPPVLGVVGFSAVGPVAGSAAAAWQSSIGAVAAGSLFATCQGAAMGSVGAMAGLATATAGAAAGTVAAVAGAGDFFKKKFWGS